MNYSVQNFSCQSYTLLDIVFVSIKNTIFYSSYDGKNIVTSLDNFKLFNTLKIVDWKTNINKFSSRLISLSRKLGKLVCLFDIEWRCSIESEIEYLPKQINSFFTTNSNYFKGCQSLHKCIISNTYLLYLIYALLLKAQYL